VETGQKGPLYTSRLILLPLFYKDTGEFACVDNNDLTNRSSVYVFVYGKTFRYTLLGSLCVLCCRLNCRPHCESHV